MKDFLYALVIKYKRRRHTGKVERRMLCDNEQSYRSHLKQAGLRGRINNSFVDGTNLTIHQSVPTLTHLIWDPAHYSPDLLEHLEW